MKNIAVFAGSTSKESINKQLAIYAGSLAENETISMDVVDLNDYPLPIYSIDIEKEEGFPRAAISFKKFLETHDGFVISLAEHNGGFAAAFKNLLDWTSRIDRNLFENKSMLLMSASTGNRGGASVLEAGINTFPRFGAAITSTFSMPNFYDNFNEGAVTNSQLNQSLLTAVQLFEKSI